MTTAVAGRTWASRWTELEVPSFASTSLAGCGGGGSEAYSSLDLDTSWALGTSSRWHRVWWDLLHVLHLWVDVHLNAWWSLQTQFEHNLLELMEIVRSLTGRDLNKLQSDMG